MSGHRSLTEDHKHHEESDRRRNYAFTPKRGSRYERQGALSPLRSPLRDQWEKRHSEGKRFTSSRHRGGEQQNRTLFTSKTDDDQDDTTVAPWQTVDKVHLSPFGHDEYPTLDHIRYTPENHQSRMSCRPLSNPSDWASQVEQYELQQSGALRDLRRYKRKLSLTDSDTSDSREREDKTSQETEEDKDVLVRRQKQIDYGRQLGAYRKYLRAVPRHLRTSQHPHTPKKFRKFSRRSWDMQIRIWKRQLHLWGQNGGLSLPPDDALSTASAGPDDASSTTSTSEGDSQGHSSSIGSDRESCDVENARWHIPSDDLADDLKSVVLDTGHTMAPLEAAVVIDCDIGDDVTLNW